MGIQELCKKFLDYDKIINGEKASTTLEELSKNPQFYEYCPKRTCVTDIDKIGALTTYLFLGINALNNNENAKYFLMWLSDKLFKMHTEKNKTKNPITLDMAYRMYLEKDLGNFRYWSLLNNVKGLKEVNLKHMADFYKLLNHICNTILDYKNNGAESKNLIMNSTNCFNQYLSLYNSVPNCSSYYHLLDNLKDIYDKFKNPVLKEIKNKNPHLAGHIQTLTTPDGVEMRLSLDFKTFDFSDEKCKSKKKKKSPKSKKTDPSSSQSLSVSSSQDKTKLKEPQESGKINQNGPDDSKSKPKGSENSKGNTVGGAGDTSDGKGGKDNKKVGSNSDAGVKSSGVSGGKIDGQGSGASDGSVSVQGDQGTTGTQTRGTSDQGAEDTQVGDTGSGARSINSGAGDGSSSEQGSTDTTKGGVSNGHDGSPGTGTDGGINNQGGSGSQANTGSGKGATDNGQVGSNGGSDSQGGTNSNQGSTVSQVGGTGGGQKPSGDQVATHSSGASSGYWSNWRGINLNITSYLPSFPSIYETQRSMLTSASNKISNAYSTTVTFVKDTYDNTVTTVKDTYNSAVDTVKGTYNSAVTTVQGAYNATTNYVGGVVNRVTNQLNSFGTSTSGDNQSGASGTGSGLSTGNSPSNTPPLPSSPTPPVTTQSQPPLTSTNTQSTISQPQSGTTQDSSQIKDQNSGPDPVQSHDTNSSTDPSKTINGDTTGTVVKMNEKTSICCIASNKKCDLMGIGIIGISIFAFLAIMYKYLSLGWTSKSKRKKTIKKVINSIGGKRPVQIIIKSYDRNKDLKPIINSVGRKKYSLLNIYKLMQADPIPFINLFFLLIFFVYKRKYDFLEL
ncbi:hypothetical protein YYE_04936 [Plasmodium vinckei vinckei]|uniref:PIR protein CIR protein n=1 Tax=Plasmodium vinckei vinckei TaxID=54757 RepID=A0A081I951_PLAVN|nr:hypothetical protein YYE_04936 [Plasmodium vinckei vinckei]